MASKQYTAEFKAEAIKQVIKRGFTVVGWAGRIGIPKHDVQLGVDVRANVDAPSSSADARNRDIS
ncbi:hypothetical protein DCO49_00160 [Stenotrophomonas sp. SPM]|nr:hypothetical protein DCO49_00160 [Stenotrophomonas sp. SPM]